MVENGSDDKGTNGAIPDRDWCGADRGIRFGLDRIVPTGKKDLDTFLYFGQWQLLHGMDFCAALDLRREEFFKNIFSVYRYRSELDIHLCGKLDDR